MNAGLLVTGAELGRILRPAKPISRTTIYRWTVEGYLPKTAVAHHGHRIRYRLAVLTDEGWLAKAHHDAV